MGETSSKLAPEVLQDLRNTTVFSGEEIQAWYKGYIKDSPGGTLTVEEFKKLYAKFFPDGDATKFSQQIFRTFDAKSTGAIDFREFICALSVSSLGTSEQKLTWAFSVYDASASGKISRTETIEVIKAIYKAMENVLKIPDDESSPETVADKIFRAKNKNPDDKLSVAEFLDGAKKPEKLSVYLFLEM